MNLKEVLQKIEEILLHFICDVPLNIQDKVANN